MRKKSLIFEASNRQAEFPGLLTLNNLTNPILPKVHSRLASQDSQPIQTRPRQERIHRGIQTQDWPSGNNSSMGWPMGGEETGEPRMSTRPRERSFSLAKMSV